MRRRKWCAKCHRNHVEKTSPSMDYCISCHASIKARLENPMLYARAVGTLVKACCGYDDEYSKADNKRLKLAGFMAVFHPEVTGKRLHDILTED